jgi:tRNA 2-selenouridine synthase
MSYSLGTLSSFLDLPRGGFDDIIDVRSPAEFAEDHIPGAINLPVLDNEERERVGTLYAASSFEARRLGAALVAQNAARHLSGPLADRGPRWRALVYCWRGGQRSGSFATILRAVGWRVEVVEGGWRSWRKQVVDVLEAPFPASVVVLDGDTGTAKTELLHRVAARGGQVIDLEGLAHHRGSVFGARAGGQPAQKGFETALAVAIASIDPMRPVLVEAESARIGRLRLPAPLWAAMRAAPRIAVAAPRAARAGYLTRAYGDIIAAPRLVATAIDGLRALHPREVIEDWQGLAESGAFSALAEDLMARHYDPAYHRARLRQQTGAERLRLSAPRLAEADLDRLADRIAAALPGLAG